MTVETIAINAVIADSRCQSRTGISLGLIQEYTEAIKEGAALPPLSSIRTPQGYYVYDGFHRLEAYRQAGMKEITVEYEDGDVWDAIERSCSVNATHGKRRTPEDTRRAVETILKVMEHRGVKWSQVEVARRCAITQQRVSQLLAEVPSYKDLYDSAPAKVTRNGAVYEMNTANIGRRRTPFLDDTSDDDEGYPPYEDVDPSDPATFLEPMNARTSAKVEGVETTITLTYRDSPDRLLTARSIAEALDREFGDGFAMVVGQEGRSEVRRG